MDKYIEQLDKYLEATSKLIEEKGLEHVNVDTFIRAAQLRHQIKCDLNK